MTPDHEAREAAVRALIADMDDPEGWLSDAQSARLHAQSHAEVAFCGEGSIDVQHAVDIAIDAYTAKLREGMSDERDHPSNWPDGAPWLERGFESAESERQDRVLITHPHDGHAEGETCLPCQRQDHTEPEWEYLATGRDRRGSSETRNHVAPELVPTLLRRGYKVQRRTPQIPAGPWGPVEGKSDE